MIFLDCPFSDKDECKSLGGRWNPEKKKWYIPDGVNSSKFKKWIVEYDYETIKKHDDIEHVIELSPSSLDYQITKCHRCFYLSKKLGIQTNNYPPPVFNKLDIIQKKFFLDKDTSYISASLPNGKFLEENELPNKVASKILKDNKGRSFKLIGTPDLVIRFDTQDFGIIDFKTTKISNQKAEFYKFQLEAYATIFENPGQLNLLKTPLLKPITKLAILQFDPHSIKQLDADGCDMNFKIDYVELNNRITDTLFNRTTLALDIINMEKPPDFNENCNDSNFFKKQYGVVNKL